MKKNIFQEDHVCPWWLAYTFDNPLRRFLHDPDAMLGQFVKQGMTVADIGCGMGYFSIAMARMAGQNGKVISVDLQQEMLDIMLKRAKKAGMVDRIQPVLAEADDIKIKGPLDFVLLFWMLHEVRDIPRFLAQLSSVLKQGGTVLYAEPKMHVPESRFQEILGLAHQAGFRTSPGPRVRISRAAVLKKEA
jgi:ubiquinone/menaquinone biosynthesis C-methylase UbiE